MLQIAHIKDNRDAVIAGLEKRNFKDAAAVVDNALEIDQNRRNVQQELDSVLAQSNAMAKQIGGLMKAGKKEEAEAAKAETGQLKAKSKELDEQLKVLSSDLDEVMYTIPNLPHSSVPAGKTPEDNEEIFKHGEVPVLHEGAKPHWDLISDYDIIDFELGNKVTGAGFPFYKGKGAKIQRALINFFLNEAEAAGYGEIQPPIMINEASGYGTGQLPDKEGQMYEATADKLFLIPTAEVPLTNMYRGDIIKEEALPIKHAGYTPCFRREAGSWGAHVRGLNRLHQFDKIEIIQIRKPEESYAALEEMVEHVKGLLEKLELPYRILRLCGGDMGFTAALTYDFEVYSAAQERWLEVSSVSNFENYQANRLKLRYKVEGKTQLLHTLNGSALALPRILASILENNQTADGINIPKVLQPFCGFDKIN
ncbi:serine--tRNA ligase [Arcticibacterium luteifluviistationis]|uniref:Serine--tRNA ligase n=1 Tax=Arcticibacterium luteifluviistationis TaxID=1784714 RepID=A0A2Z4GEI0_9BACT|nr:serine--tRNA ligase [Arcticibacterium luteifluviistationis]AWV99729.1 serine--tRNA ligase [Arcticibacterium luteifluviistationis]